MVSKLFDEITEQLDIITYREEDREFFLVVGWSDHILRIKECIKQFTPSALNNAMIGQITESGLKNWLKDLEEVVYKLEDVLDDWIEALTPGEEKQHKKIRKKKMKKFWKACGAPPEKSQENFSASIEPLCKKLEEYAKQASEKSQSITTPSMVVKFRHSISANGLEVYGRDVDKEIIIEYLMEECKEAENGPRRISIVGPAGIGKTALTCLVLDDHKVLSHFDCIQRINAADVSPIRSLNDIVGELNIQKANKLLLVLDDIWTEDIEDWTKLKESLKVCTNESRILITTRKEEVANVVESTIYKVNKLTQRDCWKVFRQAAFPGSTQKEMTEFEEIGKKLVKKCKGVPLIAKALGSSFQGKHKIQVWKECQDKSIWELHEVKQCLWDSLLLGYNNLRPEVKRCLLYCAVIQKGQLISKGDLIKLWMAQGYLFRKGAKMESIGEEYFQRLASASFFQNIKRTHVSDNVSCTIHDMVYDLALKTYGMIPENSLVLRDCERLLFVTKGNVEEISNSDLLKDMNTSRTLLLEAPTTSSTPLTFLGRGVNIRALKIGRDLCKVPEALDTLKNLRYLDLSFNAIPESILESLLYLWNLQTLNIRGCKLQNLPKELNKLVALRSIDLSGNEFIDELPKSLYDLTNLRVLIVRECSRLKRLHGNIKKLRKLILLDLSGNELLEELATEVCELDRLQTLNLSGCKLLTSLPNRIGNLTNLRQLDILDTPSLNFLPKGIAQLTSLKIMTKFPASDDSEHFNFEDLGKLENLEGHLNIGELENVANVSEVKKAGLKTKKMHSLHMCFGGLDDDNVIDVLVPNKFLERLTIQNYRGIAEFPSWIISLHKLSKLVLIGCSRCDRLPAAGELPSLVYLEIRGMESVEEIGAEFLGGENLVSQYGSKTAFPKLEKLKISWMRNWEHWTGNEDTAITIMPSLVSLTINWCPKLKAIPKFLSRVPLKNLVIKSSPIIEQRCRIDGGEDRNNISHIPSISTSSENKQDSPKEPTDSS